MYKYYQTLFKCLYPFMYKYQDSLFRKTIIVFNGNIVIDDLHTE